MAGWREFHNTEEGDGGNAQKAERASWRQDGGDAAQQSREEPLAPPAPPQEKGAVQLPTLEQIRGQGKGASRRPDVEGNIAGSSKEGQMFSGSYPTSPHEADALKKAEAYRQAQADKFCIKYRLSKKQKAKGWDLLL